MKTALQIVPLAQIIQLVLLAPLVLIELDLLAMTVKLDFTLIKMNFNVLNVILYVKPVVISHFA